MPPLRRTLLPLALLGMLLAAGCSGTRPRATLPTELPSVFPSHTAAQILENLALNPDTLRALSARANVSMELPENTGSFTAHMQARRDDSLFMSVRVTFGIEAARALVTPDSFFLYDRINKRLVFGPIEYATDFLPAPLVQEDLLPNLLGLITPDPDAPWQVSADSALYFLHDPNRGVTLTVDPILWRVVRYEIRDPEGTIIEERDYTDFDRFQDLYLPRRIVYRRPLEKTYASLFYRDLTLNPANLVLTLDVGADVERVPVYALK